MLTKNQYCRFIIEEFAKDNKLKLNEVKESHILASSNLAVAMEHLDLIKNKEYVEYASHRGGLVAMYFDEEKGEPFVLSVREILELLPE